MSKTRATAEVTYRRAAGADLPRLFEVYRAALNGYLVPAGQEPVLEQNDQQPVYEHLLRLDGERLWVAERDGEVVAWGSGLVRGDWWFLADLFVLPEAQGLGIGGRLFELAAAGAPPGAVRATVTDSLQPISNTLYAHRGLLPREVLVGFGGRPREGLQLPPLGTLEPEGLTVASIPELREIDAAALLERDIETVTAYGIADLGRRGAVEKVSAGVTGSCERAQRAFWEAGLVFDGTPGLLLASRPFGRLDRYVVASYGLF